VHLHGLIRDAELQEDPPGSDRIEMILRIQGVGPGQPRQIVIPWTLLLQDESLDPDNVAGRGFDADVEEDDGRRWVVQRIGLTARVLRPKGS